MGRSKTDGWSGILWCPACRTELPENTSRCSRCLREGVRELAVVCTACGSQNLRIAYDYQGGSARFLTFCNTCGYQGTMTLELGRVWVRQREQPEIAEVKR